MCTERCRDRARGFTLIELIVFIVVVSIGLTGILSVMNVTVRWSADPVVRKQSLAFAEAILEEVLAKDFAANAAYDTSGANCVAPDRALCDDVNDYACFDGSTPAKTIAGNETLGAAALAGLANLSARVAVADVAISAVTMRRVTVTVTGGSEPVVLVGYRGNF